jgi:tyrosinase
MRHVQIIANEYTGNEAPDYQEAAQTLRIPYWDWAVAPGLPVAVTVDNFMINSSTGLVNFRNPLYSYRFQQFPFKDPNFAGPLAAFSETKRCADQGGNEDFPMSSQELTKDGSTLQDKIVSRSELSSMSLQQALCGEEQSTSETETNPREVRGIYAIQKL